MFGSPLHRKNFAASPLGPGQVRVDERNAMNRPISLYALLTSEFLPLTFLPVLFMLLAPSTAALGQTFAKLTGTVFVVESPTQPNPGMNLLSITFDPGPIAALPGTITIPNGPTLTVTNTGIPPCTPPCFIFTGGWTWSPVAPVTLSALFTGPNVTGEIDIATPTDPSNFFSAILAGGRFAYTATLTYTSCQVNVLFDFLASGFPPFGVPNPRSYMAASFTPQPAGTTVFAFAKACGFDHLNWQNEITHDDAAPGGSTVEPR
jgi:hypothetical protein